MLWVVLLCVCYAFYNCMFYSSLCYVGLLVAVLLFSCCGCLVIVVYGGYAGALCFWFAVWIFVVGLGGLWLVCFMVMIVVAVVMVGLMVVLIVMFWRFSLVVWVMLVVDWYVWLV